MHKRLTILLADDDENDRLFLKIAFKKTGYSDLLQFVEDGAEAIEYLMGEGKYADRTTFPYPTFIITDLKMPRVDGFGVLEFLRSNPEWGIIPSVVHSASEDPDDIKKAYLLGASSYHIKSKDRDGLIYQIRVLRDYWSTCKVPAVDSTGRQLRTYSVGKIGQDIPQAGDIGMPHADTIRRPKEHS